ncbi:MAG: glycoside hydrolase family 76 protein [Dysgonamonadaceae bacterium]|jgi:predicted alpha-1,6-mannanase (GH76 family)|nr:glycoside hydrolase family 76 protein [Dysgonamonadaceae bacterium]
MTKIPTILLFLCLALSPLFAGNGASEDETAQAKENIRKSIALIDSAMSHHFKDSGIARYYNPYTNAISDETASVWMYTSAIEAVNANLHAISTLKQQGKSEAFYNQCFKRYVKLLGELYKNLDFYAGTFTLTSYTQTKEWTVYGVDRGKSKGTARVEGIYNVYDDQQWLIREMIESYRLTGNKKYLSEAEYLSEYVLDGWDCSLDENAEEHGGITWGPGYTTKHACSNAPMISPLVWLHQLYKGKNDKITYRYIDENGNRKTATQKKSEYYLAYAEKIYAWQKKHLLRKDGVFHDMLGGCVPDCKVAYESVNGTTYRKHTPLTEAVGKAHTYNSGTMISGATDLFLATQNSQYFEDAIKMSRASFGYFAVLGATIPQHYTYPSDGFSNWFNGVLMRSYAELSPSFSDAGKYLDSFQQNLDYAYAHFLHRGVLPPNLLSGWKADMGRNKTEGMFSFTFAGEYAVLARHLLIKKINTI